MFKTILVPTDGSALSDKAVSHAIELARLAAGRIVVLSVAEPYPYTALSEGAVVAEQNMFEKETTGFAQSHVDRAAALAREANVSCEREVSLSFSPYEEILRVAEAYRCDLIVMASHGRKGLDRLLLGSETQKVLAHTTLPVLVLR